MAEELKTPITDAEVESVSGGAGSWQQYSHGSFVNYGSYIVYTVAPGDVLSGIAARFGVTVQNIKDWNPTTVKNVDLIYADTKLTIYPAARTGGRCHFFVWFSMKVSRSRQRDRIPASRRTWGIRSSPLQASPRRR